MANSQVGVASPQLRQILILLAPWECRVLSMVLMQVEAVRVGHKVEDKVVFNKEGICTQVVGVVAQVNL